MLRACVTIAGLLAAIAASAADISISGTVNDGWGDLQKIVLSGKIVKGDAKRIGKIVTEDSSIVFLKSSGGDYREGLALAELFKAKKVRTAVASGDSCLSACAIAFLGGSAYGEEGTEPFARTIGVQARLGFHAPFIAIGDGSLTPEAVEAAYDHAILTVTDFVRAASGLGIDAEVAADMMTPQRSSLYRITTVRDAFRVGVNVTGMTPPSAMTTGMIKNTCINGWIAGTGETWETAEAAMVHVLDDLAWKSEATIGFKTGYFSPEVVPAKRSILPMMQGGEGVGYFVCVVDHAIIDGVLSMHNHGYVFVEEPDRIVAAATAFSADGDRFDKPDFQAKFFIKAINPLDRMNWRGDELTLEVVPMNTRLDEVEATISGYLETEPALSADNSGAAE